MKDKIAIGCDFAHDYAVDAWALFAAYCMADLRPQARRVRVGVLFKPGSMWVGAHWSKRNRRICLNLIPCVTIWVALRGGYSPAEGDAPIRKVGMAPELGMGFHGWKFPKDLNWPGAP